MTKTSSSRYLVVIHVPFARRADGVVVTGDMWIKDLRGMARELGPLSIAAPLVSESVLTPMSAGSFSFATVSPSDAELAFLPLPEYRNARTFLTQLPRTILLLRRYIRKSEIVHVGTGGWPVPQGEIAFFLAWRRRKTLLFFIGDGRDTMGAYRDKLRRDASLRTRLGTRLLATQLDHFCRFAARRADLVFFHNPVTSSRYAAYARHSCTLQRTFVEERMILQPGALQRKLEALARRRPLRCIMAGRLTPIKGVDHALQGVAGARQRGANVRLTILGDGPERGALERLAQDLAIDTAVSFVGTVPYGEALFDALRDHDVLLVCNLTDELSRNVLLGMALGCVVLSYENPASSGVLKHRENGLLCRRADIDDLGNVLAQLESDREMCQLLVRGGLETSRRNTFGACHRTRAVLIRKIASEREGHGSRMQHRG